MNEAPALEIVDLGDAKTLTKGWINQNYAEDSVDFPTRPLP